jgi:hypothetical protein
VLIELTCAELSAAWQAADLGSLPHVFVSRGSSAAAGDSVRGRLAALGLIDPRGEIHPVLRAAMVAFAGAPVELQLRHATRRGACRAAVAVADEAAVLAVVTGDHVRFSRLPAGAAVAALIGVLPVEPPARGSQVTLPLAEVDAAITRGLEPDAERLDADDLLVAELSRRGVAAPDARLFAALAGGRRVRTAEFGLCCRDRAGARHRCPDTIQVVDTRRGRTLLHRRGDYLVATPADEATIVRALTELRAAGLDRLGGNRLG